MTNLNMEILKKDVQTLIGDAQILFKDASDAGGERASELRAQGASLLQQASCQQQLKNRLAQHTECNA